jgi:hypothetical protein
MSKRVASQLKKLTAAAKTHNLKEFNTTKGTIDQRKTFFQVWSNILQELLASKYRYQALLRNYPRLNTTELTVTGNTALGQFQRLLLRKSPRDYRSNHWQRQQTKRLSSSSILGQHVWEYHHHRR